MKVRAALQVKSRGMVSIRDVELEKPRADEALVKISASGICHTDIMMQHGSSDYLFLLGHEGSGIIERTGSRVTGFAPGDHVVISYTSCGHCPACAGKQPYKCASLYSPFFLGYARTEPPVFLLTVFQYPRSLDRVLFQSMRLCIAAVW